MLNAAGALKISDFGISSQLAETAAFCSTFVGTTCYMSPERLAGDEYVPRHALRSHAPSDTRAIG